MRKEDLGPCTNAEMQALLFRNSAIPLAVLLVFCRRPAGEGRKRLEDLAGNLEARPGGAQHRPSAHILVVRTQTSGPTPVRGSLASLVELSAQNRKEMDPANIVLTLPQNVSGVKSSGPHN